jgi:hypothetical protein
MSISTLNLRQLADEELLSHCAKLARSQQRVTAQLVAHIREVDVRRLYLSQAYSSMFGYCVGELHLSEASAYNHIHAARLARRFPSILTMLHRGELHLSAVKLVSAHLNEQNHAELLSAAKHKSKRQIEKWLAEKFPKPMVSTKIRKLPMPRTSPTSPGAQSESLAPGRACRPSRTPLSTVSKPIRRDRYKVEFTASAQLHEKLQRAADLLGHKVNDGHIPDVIEAALDVLIARVENQKFGVTKKPRAVGNKPEGKGRAYATGVMADAKPEFEANSKAKPKGSRKNVRPRTVPRTVPRAVRRRVYERDGAQCTFTSPRGRRCTERCALEFHHIVPHARGGDSSEENITLRCRLHNQHAALSDFGHEHMGQWLPGIEMAQTHTKQPTNSA